MLKADYIIIDFDSTFISNESLDILAESCPIKHENHHEIIEKIKKITEQGMSGEINFKDSLKYLNRFYSFALILIKGKNLNLSSQK